MPSVDSRMNDPYDPAAGSYVIADINGMKGEPVPLIGEDFTALPNLEGVVERLVIAGVPYIGYNALFDVYKLVPISDKEREEIRLLQEREKEY